jgi:hypothetical protein
LEHNNQKQHRRAKNNTVAHHQMPLTSSGDELPNGITSNDMGKP